MNSVDEVDKKALRVVLVTAGEPHNAGLVVSIGKLVSTLNSIGATVRLITRCDTERVAEIGADRIVLLPYRSPGIIGFIRGQLDCTHAILRLHRDEPIDVIFFAFGSDLSLLPVFVGRRFTRRIVLRSDGRPSLVYVRYLSGCRNIKWLCFRGLEKAVYSRVDLLLTENEFMIEDNCFSHNASVSTGPLFLDLDRFAPKISPSQRMYELCYIGTLSKEKGVLDFIETLSRIEQRYPGIRALVCGDGDCRELIISSIEEAGLSETVTLTGWIDHEEVAQYLNQSRMLVLPSQREGLSNIVLEAMACGTLVLARPVGGIPGVVIDGVTGYHIRSPGPIGICDAIERAIGDQDGETCRTRARSRIESEFSKHVVTTHYRHLFQTIGLNPDVNE